MVTPGVAPPALDVDLATPDPVPEEAIEEAVRIMRSGKLFRYGESNASASAAAALEAEFAGLLGRRYAVGVNSCGSALFLALHCLGVGFGDVVLMNAWTLAPVAGAVQHVGGRSVLIETTEDLTVDLDDLDAAAARHPGSVLLLSHMRGHLADLDAVVQICDSHGLRLIEDCAHSLGATWAGRPTGTFGAVGCFSTQGYKHLNSGEGGLLVTDDDDVAARAVLASGSYMLYGQHTSRPAMEHVARFADLEPNHSMRMTNLTAALLRPQLRSLPQRINGWNERYNRLAAGLRRLPGVRLPHRPGNEGFVGSSLQFFVDDLSPESASRFCALADELGVHVKWFGASFPVAFTSDYRSWAYAERPELPSTDRVLSRLFDIRVPLALPVGRCADVVAILAHALATARDQDPGEAPPDTVAASRAKGGPSR
ncbi:aminotransferase class I/II-fold pyridoxal phosphate-dependent enzyme [Mycolicibacterium moriokaense]|nr:aminotransferase class I/II-fold pyridoxal phosphate-dependent enzyme [Mycolicibacterium moriokaense]